MAGEWIQMRWSLPDEPEVIAIADALDMDEFDVVGRLHFLWSWAEQSLRDGCAPCVTRKWIDRRCRCEGFAEALHQVGWLDLDDGVRIPQFNKYLGKLAKRRALSARRMTVLRNRCAGSATDASLDGDGESTRSSDSTRSEGLKNLDPDEIARVAKHISKTVGVSQSHANQDRILLARIAMLQLIGVLSSDELETILERIRQRKPKKPPAYLTKCIKDLLEKRNEDWHALADLANPPRELINGKPSA